MAKAILSAPHFHDEQAAYDYIEARLWKDGRDCPHCGVVGQSGKLKGKSTRIGVWKCYACRKPFTVKVNTVFEGSNIKLHIWLQAIHLLASSKKGFSANQFSRTLGISLKAGWFIGHRLREAMREGDLIPFGRSHGGVEADETFWGQNPNVPGDSKMPIHNMNRVLTLVDRDTGRARSMVVEKFDAATMMPILAENIAREAYLLTDESGVYQSVGFMFTFHGSVNHKEGEYVRKDAPWVHTNTVEGYFSVFKRGMRGTYQHCARKHLHRYCAEFDFRYSNRSAMGVDDQERADRILAGVKGRRLTYRTTNCGRQSAHAPQEA
jgi:transposase-like protein